MDRVLDDLGGWRQLNVLDIGPAMPETVELLHAGGCRLSIADLFETGIIEQQRHLDQDSLASCFEEALWMVDGPLHVCLLWDFLNYLSPTALSAFNQALKPWITRHTRAHAFCAAKRSAPLMQHRYGVIGRGQILQARAPEQPQASAPAPWRHVVRQLNLFEAVRGTLRTGGVVELILRGAEPQSAETATQRLGNNAGRAQEQAPKTAARHPTRARPAKTGVPASQAPSPGTASAGLHGGAPREVPEAKPQIRRRAIG